MEAIWVAGFVEDMINRRITDKTEVGEKSKIKGLMKSDRKRRYSKSLTPTTRDIGVKMKQNGTISVGRTIFRDSARK